MLLTFYKNLKIDNPVYANIKDQYFNLVTIIKAISD